MTSEPPRSWKSHFLAIDLETSGFHKNTRCLELGVVEFLDGQVTGFQSLRFNPPMLDWASSGVQEAIKVHGITQEAVKSCPPFEFQTHLIRELLDRAPVWVGHNIAYDLRCLDYEFQSLGLQRPRPVGFVACTMALDFARCPYPEEGGWKLEEAARRYGVSVQTDRHTAYVDALLAGSIFLRLAEDLPADLEEAGVVCTRARELWSRTPKRRV